MTAPPIANLARELGLPLAQPAKVAELRTWLADLGAADLYVVAAYGRILPDWLLQMPKIGPLNLHASLLPRHRGAAPIQAAILAGDTETGVTLMGMEPALDAGPVLAVRTTPIGPEDTAGSLVDRLAVLAADLLVDSLAPLLAGSLRAIPQDEAKATYAGRIDGADAELGWTSSSVEIARRVRAMAPQPGAWTMLDGQRLRILAGRPEERPGLGPGRLEADPAGLRVGCGEGSYLVTRLQPAGKPAMDATAWLRGRQLAPGAAFAVGPRR